MKKEGIKKAVEKPKRVYTKKPGPKVGDRKGITNNPNGRPVGSKNIITTKLKEGMTNFLEGNFEQFKKDLNSIEDKGFRAKLYIEAFKLVVPKPRDEEDKEKEDAFLEEFKKRIFSKE